MSSLIRLVYASRAHLGGGTIDKLVSDILAVSVVNNGRVGVTGLLMTHQGHFLQAMEGSASAVDLIYKRVADDRRHKELKVLGRGAAAERAFGKWAMCAHALSPADTEIVEILRLRGDFAPQALSEASAMRLLTAVADIQSRQAIQRVLRP